MIVSCQQSAVSLRQFSVTDRRLLVVAAGFSLRTLKDAVTREQ